MPSTVLVQELREGARLQQPSPGIGTFTVKSKIDRLSLMTAGRVGRAKEERPFEFDVDLNEAGRTEDTLTLRYSFSFGRVSAGEVCKVSGRAVVRFSRFTLAGDFQTLGNDISNEMAVAIFRENYEAVYLLHRAMDVEPPSPWITQDVTLSEHNQELE